MQRLAGQVAEELQRWSLKRQTGVSLKYMLEFGVFPTPANLLLSAQFLHKELPVRLAHRVVDLENLPHGLASKSPIQRVRDWYATSFQELRSFPAIRDSQDEASFTQLLQKVKRRHDDVVPCMAMGVRQLKLEQQVGNVEVRGDQQATASLDIQGFLDRFYMSRIGIRMLIGQHVALHHPNQQPRGYVGLISRDESPLAIAQDAITDARAICMRTYGDAPDVELHGDPYVTFAYMPAHLHHIVFELVKNSLHAVHERSSRTSTISSTELGPIKVVMADGIEDIAIKISDEGGGIPRSGLPNIWSYHYTTANPASTFANDDASSLPLHHHDPVTMAGYGCGLPLSRLHARYFGGDLQIMSMEGHGTDAYLHLRKLGDVDEPLA